MKYFRLACSISCGSVRDIINGQEEHHRGLPIGRHGEGSAQDEIPTWFAPAYAEFYNRPIALVHVRGDEEFIADVKAKGRQRQMLPVDRCFHQFLAAGGFALGRLGRYGTRKALYN